MDLAEARKTAPEIVKKILDAGKLMIHETSNEKTNRMDLFKWLTDIFYAKFRDVFGLNAENVRKILPKKQVATKLMNKLELESPGLTQYENANGDVIDREIRDKFEKRLENDRKRKITSKIE